jgi:hypothetical protein
VAWVQVKDGEISSVNLVPISLEYILKMAKISTSLGSVIVDDKNIPIAKLPKREGGMQEMTVEELNKKFKESEKLGK